MSHRPSEALVFKSSGLSASLGPGTQATHGTCDPALSRVIFVGDTAVYSGGAVYNRGAEGESSPSFTDALFGGNVADQSGGAVYHDGWEGGSRPTLVDVTFSQNQAGLSGGAVHAFTAEVSQCEDLRCPDDMSCDLVYCLE
ncbi:MAG: hypothetical protein EA397_19765 [Deltaproteobacteria bacterium]|nr:MAG: hypothetical protein EA397_19765 [Deltaproteobacteria bacterium]